MVGRSVVTPSLIEKRNFFLRNHRFSSLPRPVWGHRLARPFFRKSSLPLYVLEDDRIYIRLNADKVFVRLVLDNFHMAKYNSLLFRGTLHKNASTKGQLGWISISGLNKYKGHKGYLEITGKGNSFVEIEQVRTGNVGSSRFP